MRPMFIHKQKEVLSIANKHKAADKAARIYHIVHTAHGAWLRILVRERGALGEREAERKGRGQPVHHHRRAQRRRVQADAVNAYRSS